MAVSMDGVAGAVELTVLVGDLGWAAEAVAAKAALEAEEAWVGWVAATAQVAVASAVAAETVREEMGWAVEVTSSMGQTASQMMTSPSDDGPCLWHGYSKYR